MTDETATVKPLHDLYCRLSGRDRPMTQGSIYAWRVFQERGYTEADLRLVVPLVRKKISLGQKYPTAIWMKNMIEDEENFAEYLSEARANARKPVVDHGLNHALKCTGRPAKQEEIRVTVRSAADIIAADKAFEQFRSLKTTL